MTPPPRKPSASTGRSGRHGYGRPRKRRSTRRRKTRRLGGCRRPLRGRSSQMRGEPRPAKTATIEPRTLFLPLPPSRFLSRSLRLSLITSLLFLGGCPCPSLWFAPASVAARASARSQKSSACLCGSEDHRRVHSCCSEQPETTNLCVSGFTLTQPICLAPSATSRCVCVCPSILWTNAAVLSSLCNLACAISEEGTERLEGALSCGQCFEFSGVMGSVVSRLCPPGCLAESWLVVRVYFCRGQ